MKNKLLLIFTLSVTLSLPAVTINDLIHAITHSGGRLAKLELPELEQLVIKLMQQRQDALDRRRIGVTLSLAEEAETSFHDKGLSPLDVYNVSGNHPLWYAAQLKRADIVDLLLRYGANPKRTTFSRKPVDLTWYYTTTQAPQPAAAAPQLSTPTTSRDAFRRVPISPCLPTEMIGFVPISKGQ